MKTSQCRKILEYLQSGGSLTPMEALQMFGCMRLGARVYDLIREGYPIQGKMEVHKNENGEYKSYKRYWMA